jgi:hypothetical protein
MTTLYLIYLPDVAVNPREIEGAVELTLGLYLIQTDQTWSQLYHAIKRRLDPERLMVAPLSDLPKFKGMNAGATTAARRLDRP